MLRHVSNQVLFFVVVSFILIEWAKIGVEWVRKARKEAEYKFGEMKGQVEKRSIRNKVMDETIREMTRQALQEVDDESKRVLKNELVKAVESGNHELAKALVAAINAKNK
ncbi:hypothetical protein WIT60_13140 [Aquabacterium sp. G14]|uniref:hypothetical protein n=1 Tax=Aquabacterium sp. G14 TaxID=3130164 RepID=UPI0030A4AD10